MGTKYFSKRILSLVLALILMMALFPAGIFSVLAYDTMTEANTMYVNAFYGGGDSNGSSAKPFTTMQDAMLALQAGDTNQTGYIYFQSDYIHVVSGSSSTVDFLPAHTRHVVFTSDPTDVKKLDVRLASTYVQSSWANRFWGQSVFLRFTGPETYDNINVTFSPDPNNLLYFYEDITEIVPLVGGGTASFTFKTGTPFYNTYTFVDSDSDGIAEIASYGTQYYRRVEHLRYLPDGSDLFEVTPNASWNIINKTDNTRKNHVALPTSTTYTNDMGSIYMHPSGQVILRAGNWGNFFFYTTAMPAEGTTVTIGGTASFSTLHGPYSGTYTSNKVNIIFEDRANTLNVTDIFCNEYVGVTVPTSNLNMEVIVRTNLLNFTQTNMTAATATGKGTYTLTISDNHFIPGYLLTGYNTLRLVDGTDLNLQTQDIPTVGYANLGIEDGSTLRLMGNLDRYFTLDITRSGEGWSSTSIPVLYTTDTDCLNWITLSTKSASSGTLTYNATEGVLYYRVGFSTVEYQNIGYDANIGLPEDHTIYSCNDSIILRAPEVLYLDEMDGQVFIGWECAANGQRYEAGESFTLAEGNNLFYAVYGNPVYYVTGYENAPTPITITDNCFYAPGDDVILSDELRGTIVTNGTYDYVFYGWLCSHDQTMYYAGDVIPMSKTFTPMGFTAVWAVVQYVDATYQGVDSDGSASKPYTSLQSGYHQLRQLLSSQPSFDAGAIMFVGNQTVNLDDNTNSIFYPYPSNSTNTNYQARFKEAAKPVLITADTDTTVVIFESPTYVFYIANQTEMMYDGLTLKLNTKGTSRFLPYEGNLIFGTHFYTACTLENDTTGNRGFGIDTNAQTVNGPVVRVYGGEWEMIYFGHSIPLIDSTVIYGSPLNTASRLNLYCFNNINSNNKNNIFIKGGNVTYLSLAYPGYARVVTGSVTAVISGGKLNTLKDNQHTYSTAAHLVDATRTVIFDGYTGTVKYNHLNIGDTSSTTGDYANAIDHYAFIHHAAVTLGTDFYVKANGAGSVYVDEFSTIVYGNYDILGLSNDYSNGETTINMPQSFTACLPFGFDGTRWITTYGIGFANSLPANPSLIYPRGPFTLPDESGNIISGIAGTPDITFYGWKSGEMMYYAGDYVNVPQRGMVFTAVWAAVTYLDPNYAGGDSDGTEEKPYTCVNTALPAMKTFGENDSIFDYQAICFLDHYVWDMDDNTNEIYTYSSNATYTNYMAKPLSTLTGLLLMGETPETLLTFQSPTVFYMQFLSELQFNHIQVKLDTYTTTRWHYSNENLIFGPSFTNTATTSNTVGNRMWLVETSSQTTQSASARVYGGNWNYFYLGNGNSNLTCNIYFGSAISSPALTNVAINNMSSSCDTNLYIYSGTITYLCMASLSTVARTQKGSLNYYIKGGTISNIRDYSVTACENDCCENLVKNLVFDGWTGQFTFGHQNVGPRYTTEQPGKTYWNYSGGYYYYYGDYATGLSSVSFLNGSSVKINGSPIHMKAHPNAVVYMSEDSALQSGSLLFTGVSNDFTQGESLIASPTTIHPRLSLIWDGYSWQYHFGEVLGAAIRVRTPYGIRFGFEADLTELAALTGKTVVSKGVLIIPQPLLESSLDVNSPYVLNVPVTKPLSSEHLNQFTGCLVDSLQNPGIDWLTTWANIKFVSRAYFTLSDGSKIYTETVTRSVQDIWDILDTSVVLDETDWTDFDKIPVKNETQSISITTRAYYPDQYSFLTKLENIRQNVGTTTFASSGALASELQAAMRMALDLDLYYDYVDKIYYKSGITNFGAVPDSNKIGGGTTYTSGIGSATYTVTDDNTLKAALDSAVSGDIIKISGEVIIDLSDIVRAGDYDLFDTNDNIKIEYQFRVPAGVTLCGTRGEGTSSGAILKMTSYTENLFILEEGARLSGLVIQGPDMYRYETAAAKNLSVALVVNGDNVTIDNCEIAGFYNAAIVMNEVEGVSIHHNFIHNISGKDCGYAMKINQSTVTASYNLFANVTRVANLSGEDTVFTFTNNVETSNSQTTLFILRAGKGYHALYHPSRNSISAVNMTNNTFLSDANLFAYLGLPNSIVLNNNLFAYNESTYSSGSFFLKGTNGTFFDTMMTMTNNAFDIVTPVVLSKSSSGPATPSDPRFAPYSVSTSFNLTPKTITPYPATPVTYSNPVYLPVTTSSYYTDNNDTGYKNLLSLISTLDSKTDAQIKSSLLSVQSLVGSFSNYFTFLDNGLGTITHNDVTYGTHSVSGNPVGGGVGYTDIYTTGDYIVTNEAELRAALSQAVSGEVIFIPGNVIIDIGDASAYSFTAFSVPEGITIASNRGYVYQDGSVSTGGMIRVTAVVSRYLFAVSKDNVRFTGLVLKGADPAQHLNHWDRCFAGESYDYSWQLDYYYFYCLYNTKGISITGDYCEIDNCEISGFCSTAISVGYNSTKSAPSQGHQFHNNYIHHNQIKALGYGIVFGEGYAVIAENMFNYNRHSIAGGGSINSGYEACYNVEFGQSLASYFDMHGGQDHNAGNAYAGGYVNIHHNSFLGTAMPYSLRGTPYLYQNFDYNILYMPYTSYSYRLYTAYEGIVPTNVYIGSNIWNITNGNVTPMDGYPH